MSNQTMGFLAGAKAWSVTISCKRCNLPEELFTYVGDDPDECRKSGNVVCPMCLHDADVTIGPRITSSGILRVGRYGIGG
jgi:hypothetical protein